MKIATLNLFQFAEPGYHWYHRADVSTYRQEHWESKLDWIRQQLNSLNADVVGFQEVFSVRALEDLCQECGYKHFAVAEHPDISSVDHRVFTRPVVALASRYPFEKVGTVTPDETLLSDIDQPDFHFRRLPVKATVASPLGPLTFYVVHLKSRRAPRADMKFDKDTPWAERVRQTLTQSCRGNIIALYQSGLEASLLYHDVVKELAKEPHQGIVVMGDFNNRPGDVVLDVLTMHESVYEIGGVPAKNWPKGVKALLHDHRLADSYHLAPNMKNRPRPHTYVHYGEASVLDFILVSNALNPRNPDSQIRVSHYEAINEHLKSDGVADRQQSDHAIVSIQLAPAETFTSDIADSPAIISRVNRQTFMDMAGGVFQSKHSYTHWSRADKWDNFWSFYFDTQHGWVKSIYGRIPVSELYQRKHHTIEHIVPRSFLNEYLKRKNVPRQVRYGACVNPFNLVPAERELNSGRSNFMFDFEGDEVVRPFRIHLNPDAYASIGLDAENEWVLPAHTRGHIARAILYMLLVYDINELYTNHVDTLVHWARVDQAAHWELAYNRWIQAKFGIRNPFIDTPNNAIRLLDSVADMDIVID